MYKKKIYKLHQKIAVYNKYRCINMGENYILIKIVVSENNYCINMGKNDILIN